MDPFENLVKPEESFSEKCIYMHKIKYVCIESLSMYYNLQYKQFYKGTQLC
jgi:hypothetical protein